MQSYRTVWETCRIEQVEKRSRFITTIARVATRQEATDFINSIKSEFPDARHHVYAYSLADGYSKYSDDGEPSGTGGMPVLNVIKASELLDVAVVVTRYFGGILLGTGGLTRAYSGGAAAAVEVCTKAQQQPVTFYKAQVDYSRYNSLCAKGFDNVEITAGDFTDAVELTFSVPSAYAKVFEEEWTQRFFGDALPQFVEEKLVICKIA
ncbi:MAG: YigZ family protein [Clostridia bacterium]|nr:YigZ family protein [Clostridia bacterium]